MSDAQDPSKIQDAESTETPESASQPDAPKTEASDTELAKTLTPEASKDAEAPQADDVDPEAAEVPSSDGGDGDDGDGGDDGEDGEEGDDEDSEGGGGLLHEMSFIEHLQELRIRITRIVIAAFIGFLLCYGFAKQMFAILVEPLKGALPEGSSLIYTTLPEAFFTYIKVALVAGVFVASPYIFYQIWAFVAPGLYKQERKYLVPIAFFSALFFVTGALFGYFVVFPFAFGFFMQFSTEEMRAMPRVADYLSFSLKLLFAFGLAFEMPLFIFFLAQLGIVTAAGLRKFRKYAIICIFISSAILTPPDVISQLLMSGPLIVLFEISIVVAGIFGRKKKEKSKKPTGWEDDEDEESAESAESADTGEADETDEEKGEDSENQTA